MLLYQMQKIILDWDSPQKSCWFLYQIVDSQSWEKLFPHKISFLLIFPLCSHQKIVTFLGIGQKTACMLFWILNHTNSYCWGHGLLFWVFLFIAVTLSFRVIEILILHLCHSVVFWLMVMYLNLGSHDIKETVGQIMSCTAQHICYHDTTWLEK